MIEGYKEQVQEFLEQKGLTKRQVQEVLKFHIDTMEEIEKQLAGKEFNVVRAKNGYGESNLLVVIEEAVPDMVIGSAIIIPYVDGWRDPIKVNLRVNEKGTPIIMEGKLGIVNEFIYD